MKVKASRHFDGETGGTLSETIRRAWAGSASALNRLFGDLIPSLASWAHGKLPLWARARVDTDDLVQEAVVKLWDGLPRIRGRHRRVVRAFLRTTIRRRITDEVRRAQKVEVSAVDGPEPVSPEADPLLERLRSEEISRYREALGRLSELDQTLIVGRLELAFSYEQLALATGKASPDAARVAVRRAVLRLAEEMTN